MSSLPLPPTPSKDDKDDGTKKPKIKMLRPFRTPIEVIKSTFTIPRICLLSLNIVLFVLIFGNRKANGYDPPLPAHELAEIQPAFALNPYKAGMRVTAAQEHPYIKPESIDGTDAEWKKKNIPQINRITNSVARVRARGSAPTRRSHMSPINGNCCVWRFHENWSVNFLIWPPWCRFA